MEENKAGKRPREEEKSCPPPNKELLASITNKHGKNIDIYDHDVAMLMVEAKDEYHQLENKYEFSLAELKAKDADIKDLNNEVRELQLCLQDSRTKRGRDADKDKKAKQLYQDLNSRFQTMVSKYKEARAHAEDLTAWVDHARHILDENTLLKIDTAGPLASGKKGQQEEVDSDLEDHE